MSLEHLLHKDEINECFHIVNVNLILLHNEIASQANLFLVIELLLAHTVALNETLVKKSTVALLGQNDSVSQYDAAATPPRDAVPALP